ncbi:MAG: PKD domain-containing protein [Thermoplasmata archaeon]|nr:PKD domain-containing protein [Thermoplasmata archaeon]
MSAPLRGREGAHTREARNSFSGRSTRSLTFLLAGPVAVFVVLSAFSPLGGTGGRIGNPLASSAHGLPPGDEGLTGFRATPVAASPNRLSAGPFGDPAPNWTNITGTGPSPGLSNAALAYDGAENETILFGGISSHTQRAVNETWAYRNGSWVNLTSTAGPAPPPVLDMALAYDSADGYLVAWGGHFQGSCPTSFPDCNATWAFESGRWKLLDTAGAPAPPEDDSGLPSLTYDAAAGYVLLYDGGVYFAPGIYLPQTWSFHAGLWTRLPLYEDDEPFPGSTGVTRMAYDAADQDVVLLGGWSNNSTWTFANGSWTQVNTTFATPPLGYYDMAYVDSDDYVLLYEEPGNLTGNVSVETWAFYGGAWTEIPTSGFAGGLAGGLAYDPSLHGAMAPGFNGTTWLWGWLGLVAVSIRANPAEADPGAPVTFVATTVGGVRPLTFSWSFGDGGTSNQSSPVHSFSTTGTYLVTLNLTDANGTSRNVTTSVLILPGPTANFSAFPNSTDVGFATQFRATAAGGVGPYAFAWSFGDGTAGVGGNATHAFAAAGTYLVRGWANDSLGGSATGVVSVLVRPMLRVTALAAVPDPVDLARPVNFTAAISGGTAPFTYSWAFGDGGIGGNLSNITHIFTTNGPFVSTVEVRDALGAGTTASVNLTIRLNATIFANVSGGLAPLPVRFQGEASGGAPGYTYSWSFGDGTGSDSPSASHDFLTPGRYFVSLTVRDASGHQANASTVISVVAPTPAGATSSPLGSGALPWIVAAAAMALAAGVVIGVLSPARRKRSPVTTPPPTQP